jgi:hypothetical protein
MSKCGPRFTEKEKLAIVKEGEKNGINAVCAKYDMILIFLAAHPSMHLRAWSFDPDLVAGRDRVRFSTKHKGK